MTVSPAPRAGPLLEREREVEALEDVLTAAGRGLGRIAVVRGPPGAGKTSLMAGGRTAAARAGLTVLEARGAELEQGFAFGVVRQLLEPTVVALDDAEREEMFAGAAALAARIFDAGEEDAGGADAAFATLHGLYWLVVHLADRSPVLVSVDDCHWADTQSLGFLNYLAHRADSLAVTIVLAGRPPEGRAGDSLWAQLTALPAAVALHPQPLSEQAVGALVRGRLDPEAPEDFCTACHRATGGNPLLLRELLNAVETADTPPSADAVAAVGPAAVSRFVLHRLARLGTDATELARTAAVLGDGADLRLAADVAGLSGDAARAAADALVRADILAADERLSFVHPIVAAATYEDLVPGERERRHAAAAGRLAAQGAPAERVAAHLLLSAPTGETQRVETLRAAAASATHRGAPEASAVYLRRVLEEAPPAAETGRVLTELGRCELAAMEYVSAEQHLREAATAAADLETRTAAASLLSRCVIVSGGRSAETAAATLEAVIAQLEPDEPARALALGCDLLMLSATVPRLRAGLPERLAAFNRRAAGDPQFEAVARIHAAQEGLMRGGSAADAVQEVQGALAGGLHPEVAVTTLFLALATLTLGERYEIAMLMLDAGLENARREGHAARQSLMHGQRAAIALARGALDDAQVEAETGFALVDGRHSVLHQLSAVMTAVQLERGDLDAAAAAVAQGGALGEAEDRLFLDQYLIARGRLRIAQGDVRGGVADLLHCGERRDALELRWPSDWRAYAAPALAALDEKQRAAELAREQVALARGVGAPGALGRALRTAGEAIGGDEGFELLEEAVVVLEPSPAPLELAHALFAVGRELSRRKRRREGREALRLAMEGAVECSATALAERARAELTAGGGRRPRLELTGVGALTPAERRVCRLAATEQLTNRAIAQSLFVTEKTVELHLSSAYRKLGIRSRFQLAGALGD